MVFGVLQGHSMAWFESGKIILSVTRKSAA